MVAPTNVETVAEPTQATLDSPPVSELKRRFPRFSNTAQVELVLEGGELFTASMTDISKGGLFVKTERPLPVHSMVSVRLAGPEGPIELRAEVVHVVDEALALRSGRERGLGLQFAALAAEAKLALDRYVDAIANRMETKAMSAAERAGQAMLVMSKAASIMEGIAAEDLYRALSITPSASASAITQRVRELAHVFDEAPGTLSTPQRARVDAARVELRKISGLLGDPERRRDYDLRHGHLSNP